MKANWHRAYAAYLFDLDGTLVDTAPDLHAALNHSLSAVRIDPVSIDLTRHWVGHGARALIEQALNHHNEVRPSEEQAHIDFDAVLADFLEYYHAHIADHSCCYPSVVETLTRLRQQGAKLAVVTNKLAALSAPLLEALDLDKYFDQLIGGDTAAQPKPHPAPVLLCLEKLGIAAHDTLFVGDSATDVNAAKAAGVNVVCLRDGYNHGVDVLTLNPDGVIDLCSEVLPS